MSFPLAVPRIYNALKATPRATIAELSDRAIACKKHVYRTLQSLHKCGLAHIVDWIPRPDQGGTYQSVWTYGPGEHAPKKTQQHRDHIAVRNKRVAKLQSVYGIEITRRILNPRRKGGASRIVIDGKTIWERGKRRGAKGTVKA